MSDLLLMSASGLPRNGLVALYDPYRDAYGLDATARAALQTGVDYSGRGNTLTYGATTGASTDDPAFTGTAWSFDGGDYLKAAHNANQLSTEYTWQAVLYTPTGAYGSVRTIVAKSDRANNKVMWQILFPVNNANVRMSFQNPDGSWRESPDLGSVTFGQWNHIAVRFKDKKAQLYLNGVAGTEQNVGYDMLPDEGSIYIGCGQGLGATPGYFLANGELLALASIHNWAFPPALMTRSYRTIKSLMAQRGITLP